MTTTAATTMTMTTPKASNASDTKAESTAKATEPKK